MTKKKENTYEVGDLVRISRDIKDDYQEVWHDEGAVLEVVRIARDGKGLMFHSDLGIHFSEVELVEKALRCECCGQVIPRD